MAKVIRVLHDPDCTKLHVIVTLENETIYKVISDIESEGTVAMLRAIRTLIDTFNDSIEGICVIYTYEKPVNYHGAVSDPNLIKQLLAQTRRIAIAINAEAAKSKTTVTTNYYTPGDYKGGVAKPVFHKNMLKYAKDSDVAVVNAAIIRHPNDALDILDCLGLLLFVTGKTTRGGIGAQPLSS